MVNSRTKGLTAERAVANYFKAHGWPDARRSVATGWSNGNTEHQDLGDIDGVPGLCVQVKNLARRLEGKLLADTWAEAQRQTTAVVAHTGRPAATLLVEKRAGTTDVGRWWVYLTGRFYVELLTGTPHWVPSEHVVRVELGDVTQDLRLWCQYR